MSFPALAHPAAAPALIDAASGTVTSYGDLAGQADACAARLPAGHGFLAMGNDVPSVVGYLAALRARRPALLLARDLAPELRARLADAYRPAWMILPPGVPAPAGWRDGGGSPRLLVPETTPQPVPLHPDLALLLATSGTTGSPKAVRLSLGNLAANAVAIADYLGLGPAERPITTLPPSYSYGLSVINSHLHAGAAIILSEASVLEPRFWEAARIHGATSLAGVPFTWQALRRVGIERQAPPTLRTCTQAGGRLDETLQRHFAALAAERGWRFFVMYGQTEATARIAFVPPALLGGAIGAIGQAIPGGRLELDPASGELIYHGANVMLGYAESAADLLRGDELGGVLHTGDLGMRGDDGLFRITGRCKRFLKLHGLRINLDEVERELERHLGAPCWCVGDDSRLVVVSQDAERLARSLEHLTALYHIHRSAIAGAVLETIPRLDSGKPDYAAIATAAGVAR